MFCLALLCYAMLCHAMLCLPMFCCVVPCYVLLCDALIWDDTIWFDMIWFDMIWLIWYASFCYMNNNSYTSIPCCLHESTYKYMIQSDPDTLFILVLLLHRYVGQSQRRSRNCSDACPMHGSRRALWRTMPWSTPALWPKPGRRREMWVGKGVRGSQGDPKGMVGWKLVTCLTVWWLIWTNGTESKTVSLPEQMALPSKCGLCVLLNGSCFWRGIFFVVVLGAMWFLSQIWAGDVC